MRSLVRAAVPAPSGHADRPGLAIGLVLIVMLIFVVMDAIAKHLTVGGMQPEVLTAVRYGMVLLALAPVLAWKWPERPLAPRPPRLHQLRGALLIFTATPVVYALRYLSLETATAISFASPLFVTALSVPFLGEKVGWRRWAAVGLGFVGVLLIVKPGTDSFHWAMLLPLTTSLFWASGLIITRSMRGTEKPLTVLAWSTGAGFLVILPLAILKYEQPSAEEWLWLAAVAVCHLSSQYLMIRAYMMAAASMLAPFSYTTLLWAVLIGVFVFGSLPDWLTVIGASILAGAGLYVWHRERMLARRAARPAEPELAPAESSSHVST
jgi:drug/metabolite transporter (DMT)-like permease